MLNLLKFETQGFRVITVGSSAGGYAAILFGCQLDAEKIFAFNPQFELNQLLETSTQEINPLLFRLKDTALREFFDIVPFIRRFKNDNIFYFYSEKSQWDLTQYQHLKQCSALSLVNVIGFNNKLHGVPFPRVALNKVLNLPVEHLKSLCGYHINPILFSIRQVGFLKTIQGVTHQIYKYLTRKN